MDQIETPDILCELAQLKIAQPAAALVAPRRMHLIRSMGGNPREMPSIPGRGKDNTATLLVAMTLEGPYSAVGLAFSDAASFPWTIKSATIYPADTFGEAARLYGNARGLRIVPTIGGKPSPRSVVYFDANGNGTKEPNPKGKVRRLVLQASSNAKGDNAPAAFRMLRSDLSPCHGTRYTGGPGHPVFLFIAIEGSGYAGADRNFRDAWSDSLAHRNRPIFVALADQPGDFSDHPDRATWSWFPLAPIFAIEYLSRRAGVQIMQTGDSLSVGYLSSGTQRAAFDASTPLLPIEVCNFAMGGGTRSIYLRMVEMHAPFWQPSILTMQPISRNDGEGIEPMRQNVLANLRTAAGIAGFYGTRIVMHSGTQQPEWDTRPHALAGWPRFAGVC